MLLRLCRGLMEVGTANQRLPPVKASPTTRLAPTDEPLPTAFTLKVPIVSVMAMLRQLQFPNSRLNIHLPAFPAGWATISERRQCSVRLCHFEHRMAEFFMWKLAANAPALAFIEVNGADIRLDHAQTKCLMSSTADLQFRLRQ